MNFCYLSRPLGFVIAGLLLFGSGSCAAPADTATGASALAVQPIVLPGERTAAAAPAAITLADNGRALVPIVLAADATPALKDTAAYLAARLEKITGAKWKITIGDGQRGLVLGTWAQFPVPALQGALQTREVLAGSGMRNGAEAFAIRTEPQRLLLLGGGELGASHAAARFLELLGYRQFYPSPAWEVVPALPVLKFAKDETDRPSILVRRIDFSYGVPEDARTPENWNEPRETLGARARADIAAWRRQNRLGSSFYTYAAHNYANIIESNQAAFDAHPEYYSLIDGVRVPRTICQSNPEVRRMAVQTALDYLKKYPADDMYSMEPGDGSAMCECPICMGLGNYSDRVFGLANEVARAVRAKMPGKKIGVLAYNTHSVPPKSGMEPNVHVQVARLFITGPYPFKELLRQWSLKTKNLGVYEYFSTYQHGQDRLRGRPSSGPTADLDFLKDDIAYIGQMGALQLQSESSVAWGAHGRGNYVATRMMWNPGADVDAVLHDFYAKTFGPAAPVMKRYYERVDGDNAQLGASLLGLAIRDVEEAAGLAKDRPDVLARIAEIKEFLYYNYLQYRVLNAKDDAESKPFVFKLLQHEYRTRNTYMTHWQGTRSVLSDFATQYKEPGWNFPSDEEGALAVKNGTPFGNPPWLESKDYSPDEIERNFQEARDYLKPVEMQATAKYSTDLVPVDLGGEKGMPTFQTAGYGFGIVCLYSVKGEPLDLVLVGDKTETDCFYSLTDKAGKDVTRGTVPADGKDHPLSLKVPGPGFYQLHIKAGGWWLYGAAPGTPNVMSLQDPQMISGFRYGGFTYEAMGSRNFFYVPRGTRKIQFFWQGEPHTILDAEGKVIAAVPISSDYVTVDVPEGKDGTAWSFTGKQQPRFFVNIPNYFAPWPSALMVPRELAIKDGLKIRK